MLFSGYPAMARSSEAAFPCEKLFEAGRKTSVDTSPVLSNHYRSCGGPLVPSTASLLDAN